MTHTDYAYEGSELDVFANAIHWKAYWGSIIRPYLGARVLEVGAGIGTTARLLCGTDQTQWVALEPDLRLAARIVRAREERLIPEVCLVRTGTLADVAANELFDSILYIDVLEHIEDDRTEVERAAAHLAPAGRLIVLAPAHQRLFTPFDTAIGHFRRYDRGMLSALTPPNLNTIRIDYLDSIGLLASLGNRLILKATMPTAPQISLWDNWMVPISQMIDPILSYRLGKSVLAVWQKPS